MYNYIVTLQQRVYCIAVNKQKNSRARFSLEMSSIGFLPISRPQHSLDKYNKGPDTPHTPHKTLHTLAFSTHTIDLLHLICDTLNVTSEK